MLSGPMAALLTQRDASEPHRHCRWRLDLVGFLRGLLTNHGSLSLLHSPRRNQVDPVCSLQRLVRAFHPLDLPRRDLPSGRFRLGRTPSGPSPPSVFWATEPALRTPLLWKSVGIPPTRRFCGARCGKHFLPEIQIAHSGPDHAWERWSRLGRLSLPSSLL